jgi:hypothetical protein
MPSRATSPSSAAMISFMFILEFGLVTSYVICEGELLTRPDLRLFSI